MNTQIEFVKALQSRFAVEHAEDNLRFNLSQMAKPFGESKKPTKWLRTDEAKEYVNVLSVALKCPTADLLIVRQGGKVEYQGTWCTDYRIALRFAQWLSPEFSVAVDTLIIGLITKQIIESEIRLQKVTTSTNEGILHEFHSRVRTIKINGVTYYKVGDIKHLCRVTESWVLMKKIKPLDNFIKIRDGYVHIEEYWCNIDGVRQFITSKKNLNFMRLNDALFPSQLSLL